MLFVVVVQKGVVVNISYVSGRGPGSSHGFELPDRSVVYGIDHDWRSLVRIPARDGYVVLELDDLHCIRTVGIAGNVVRTG